MIGSQARRMLQSKGSLLFLLFLAAAGFSPASASPEASDVSGRSGVASRQETAVVRKRQTPLPSPPSSELQEKETCGRSGVHRFPPKQFSIGFKGRALSKKALKILAEAEQSHQKHCPAACQQENVYKTFIRIQPARSKSGSCPAEQAKESYSFKKTYTLKGGGKGRAKAAPALDESDQKKAKKLNRPQAAAGNVGARAATSAAAPATDAQAAKPLNDSEKQKKSREALIAKADDWILRTFVYPYIPGVRFTPTKEGSAHKTAEACPKCSFYFDYNYFFENKQSLFLDIAVRCGDRKRGLGAARAARLQIQNHWRCRKRE